MYCESNLSPFCKSLHISRVILKKMVKTATATITTNTKRKSKFKKCPNAPKRFKSAYIFFSTAMMQKIKAQQKGSADEKQKVSSDDDHGSFVVVYIYFSNVMILRLMFIPSKNDLIDH